MKKLYIKNIGQEDIILTRDDKNRFELPMPKGSSRMVYNIIDQRWEEIKG